MQKGFLTIRILETIADFISEGGDLLGALMEAGYGASASRVNYARSRKENERIGRARKSEEDRVARERLSRMLYYLEHDGLIARNGPGKMSLTRRGKERLRALRARIKGLTLTSPAVYPKKDTTATTVVIFDIPELEKKKRAWVRAVLKRLEYVMIQRSVWMGTMGIPREFVTDLRDQKILHCVQFFAVTRGGTLRHMMPATQTLGVDSSDGVKLSH